MLTMDYWKCAASPELMKIIRELSAQKPLRQTSSLFLLVSSDEEDGNSTLRGHGSLMALQLSHETRHSAEPIPEIVGQRKDVPRNNFLFARGVNTKKNACRIPVFKIKKEKLHLASRKQCFVRKPSIRNNTYLHDENTQTYKFYCANETQLNLYSRGDTTQDYTQTQDHTTPCANKTHIDTCPQNETSQVHPYYNKIVKQKNAYVQTKKIMQDNTYNDASRTLDNTEPHDHSYENTPEENTYPFDRTCLNNKYTSTIHNTQCSKATETSSEANIMVHSLRCCKRLDQPEVDSIETIHPCKEAGEGKSIERATTTDQSCCCAPTEIKEPVDSVLQLEPQQKHVFQWGTPEQTVAHNRQSYNTRGRRKDTAPHAPSSNFIELHRIGAKQDTSVSFADIPYRLYEPTEEQCKEAIHKFFTNTRIFNTLRTLLRDISSKKPTCSRHVKYQTRSGCPPTLEPFGSKGRSLGALMFGRGRPARLVDASCQCPKSNTKHRDRHKVSNIQVYQAKNVPTSEPEPEHEHEHELDSDEVIEKGIPKKHMTVQTGECSDCCTILGCDPTVLKRTSSGECPAEDCSCDVDGCHDDCCKLYGCQTDDDIDRQPCKGDGCGCGRPKPRPRPSKAETGENPPPEEGTVQSPPSEEGTVQSPPPEEGTVQVAPQVIGRPPQGPPGTHRAQWPPMVGDKPAPWLHLVTDKPPPTMPGELPPPPPPPPPPPKPGEPPRPPPPLRPGAPPLPLLPPPRPGEPPRPRPPPPPLPPKPGDPPRPQPPLSPPEPGAPPYPPLPPPRPGEPPRLRPPPPKPGEPPRPPRPPRDPNAPPRPRPYPDRFPPTGDGPPRLPRPRPDGKPRPKRHKPRGKGVTRPTQTRPGDIKVEEESEDDDEDIKSRIRLYGCGRTGPACYRMRREKKPMEKPQAPKPEDLKKKKKKRKKQHGISINIEPTGEFASRLKRIFCFDVVEQRVVFPYPIPFIPTSSNSY